MTLGEKIRNLRLVEGQLRGLGREMTQTEVVTAIRKELGQRLSQAYLSQIESGARPHLTATTRHLLSSFFKVHPGYLVDDPPGYQEKLTAEIAVEQSLDRWLIESAEHFGGEDPQLRDALLMLAARPDSRECLLLLGRIISEDGLVARLTQALAPGAKE